MCRQDMGHLTPWATDSRQILWRRDGGNRRSTAPRVHARSLPENMAFRSDILSEARQNGAGDYEHTARAMSRHVMWHQLRAMREENRAILSGGPRRFIRQTTIASNNRGDMRCPRLQDLPEPPSGKRGWPWTEESTPL